MTMRMRDIVPAAAVAALALACGAPEVPRGTAQLFQESLLLPHRVLGQCRATAVAKRATLVMRDGRVSVATPSPAENDQLTEDVRTELRVQAYLKWGKQADGIFGVSCEDGRVPATACECLSDACGGRLALAGPGDDAARACPRLCDCGKRRFATHRVEVPSRTCSATGFQFVQEAR